MPSVGLYSNVKATSTVVENAGYSNLWNHNNMLTTTLGRQASMGDLAWNDPYFAPYNTSRGLYTQPGTQMLNSIDAGSKIAEIMLLDRNALAQAGFESNFNSPVGSEVFGFRVARSALPSFDNKSFIATLLTECINDGIALSWNPTPPPPPPPPPKTVCPVDPGQLNAVQPTQVIDKTKYFENASSELWYDPPATMGYQLIVKGDGSITEIQGFPCLVDPSGENTFALPFKISVKDKDGIVKDLGIQQPGGNIDIVKALNGSGAKEVIITGIDSDEWENKPAPAFKLRFDKPGVELLVTEISDTTIPTPPKVIQLPREPIILPPIDPIDPPVGPTPYPTAAVPEPSEMAGLALAAAGLFGLKRRFRKK
jgi:hypothetical protein